MTKLFQYFSYRQYIKNFIIFLPLFFENIFFLNTFFLLSKYILVFISLCIAAQSVYILNDYKDKKNDKIIGKNNIFNNIEGKISNKNVFLSFCLMNFINIIILTYLVQISKNIVLLVLFYYFINIFYNYFFKRIKYIDIFCIATLYVIRILIGIEILDGNEYYIDSILFIFMGSLLLLSSKRYIYSAKQSLFNNVENNIYKEIEIKNLLIIFTFLLNLFSIYFLFFENGQMINTNITPNIFLFLLIVYTSYTYSKSTLKKNLSLDIVKNLMKISFSIPITIFIILYIYTNT